MQNHNKQIIHFCHIPKCGGKSFLRSLEKEYGDNVHTYYTNPMRRSTISRLLYGYGQLKRSIFPEKYLESYEIIYGHFCFDSIYASPNIAVKRGAFFRDPVEWFGSYYFYVQEKFPDKFVKDPIKMINQLGLNKGFRKHLGSIQVPDLDFIGLIEEYEDSLALYNRLFSTNLGMFFENKTKSSSGNYRDYFEKQGILGDIEDLMHDNQKIYEQAVSRYKELKLQ